MRENIKVIRILLIFMLTIATILPNFSSIALAIEDTPAAKSAQISITMLDGKEALPWTNASFSDGESVFDLLKRVTAENNIPLSYRSTDYGKYIEGINDLYEFDKGPLSGWMYSVNGEFLNYSADLRKLQEGDRVAWMYTENLGADVGDTSNLITQETTPIIEEPVDSAQTEITPQPIIELTNEDTSIQPVPEVKNELTSTQPVPEEKKEITTTQTVSEEKVNTISIPVPTIIKQETVKVPAVTPEQAYNNVAQYMLKTVTNPGYGNEWFIITLARGNYAVPTSYYETYYQNVVKHVKSVQGQLNNRKYTEYARVILALSAIGKDAQNVGGFNLVEKLYDFNKVVSQGINGPIFALIALDSQQFVIPTAASNSREQLIDYILNKQLTDGGFTLSGTQADVDITAMAIQALSTYKNQPNVATAIDKALEALANLQQNDGSYTSWDVANSESIAQVITALTSVNIDPTKDSQFATTMDNLLSFYNKTDGGFKHTSNNTAANGIATEQAGYALAAYKRLIAGQTKLYDMTDIPLAAPIITQVAASFTDTKNHWAKPYIDEAVQLKLLNGFNDGTFKPQQDLTRVQAASIIARSLSLTANGTAPFTDITSLPNATKEELTAAYEAGIIKGSNGLFNPTSKVTRMQLALMLARAYAHKQGQEYTSSQPLPFSDITSYNTESKQAVTMLVDFEIVTGSNGLFNPKQFTTRAQAAKMLVNFHKALQER